ncbi:trafficking protein particle complex subunit 14 [Menidia menidia]
MVPVMESQCEYFMYFPAVPLLELWEPARYRALPRRSHLFLGETVRFLLVLRCRDGGGTPPQEGPDGAFGSESAGSRAWRELAGSLSAVASVSPGEGGRHRGPRDPQDPRDQDPRDQDPRDPEDQDQDQEDYLAAAAALGGRLGGGQGFRDCSPMAIHNRTGPGAREVRRAPVQSPLDQPVVLADEVIFPLTVSLDKLPVSTLKVKVMVTVWRREAEQLEVQELGYLSVLQQGAPSRTFRRDLDTFKAQGEP